MSKVKNLKKLNEQWELVCNEWVKAFCEKQELEFDGWIGNDIGGTASFALQYYFNLSDIILDLNTKQKKWFIMKWQNDGVDFNMDNEDTKHINYKSFIMGMRYKDLK